MHAILDSLRSERSQKRLDRTLVSHLGLYRRPRLAKRLLQGSMGRAPAGLARFGLALGFEFERGLQGEANGNLGSAPRNKIQGTGVAPVLRKQ